MDTEVICAILALVGTMGGSLGGILVSNKLSNYRIEQLEKKVEKHNNLVERVYRLEQREAVVDEKMAVANHRISDLESICRTAEQ